MTSTKVTPNIVDDSNTDNSVVKSMTNEPERIWAVWTENFGAVQIGTWADSIRFARLGSEYIRADLSQAALDRAIAQAVAERDAEIARMREATPAAHVAAEQAEPAVTAMLATIRALLAQLEGYPVKHPQQQAERDIARWLTASKETKPTPPEGTSADTWHERRTMLPDGDPRKEKEK
jgi:hypothetical protein